MRLKLRFFIPTLLNRQLIVCKGKSDRLAMPFTGGPSFTKGKARMASEMQLKLVLSLLPSNLRSWGDLDQVSWSKSRSQLGPLAWTRQHSQAGPDSRCGLAVCRSPSELRANELGYPHATTRLIDKAKIVPQLPPVSLILPGISHIPSHSRIQRLCLWSPVSLAGS